MITGAALIMIVVFASFTLSSILVLKELGFGLAAAVLIDATVVRVLLVPAVMRLLGDSAWWLPRWLDRILPDLDVEGHAQPLSGDEPDEPVAPPEREPQPTGAPAD